MLEVNCALFGLRALKLECEVQDSHKNCKQ